MTTMCSRQFREERPMERVEVVQGSVDKDGHDSSRVVGFVGELVATRTSVTRP